MIGFNNKKIGFIVDTSFGLDKKADDVKVIPLGINIANGRDVISYKDGEGFDKNILITALENKESNVKTNQPAMADMIVAAEEMSEKYDEIYVFPTHQKLSSAYNAWNIVREDFPKLKVIMSWTIANTLFWLLEDFRKLLQQQEMSEAQAQAWFNEESKYIAGFGLIQDMGQLVKGGRLSGFKAGIAKLFNIKLAIVQDEQGLRPIDKVRNYEGFLKQLMIIFLINDQEKLLIMN